MDEEQPRLYEFDAEIIRHDSLDSGYVEFPYDAEQEFGAKGQVKVRATFDGFEYRGSLVKMGHPCHVIGLTKEVRRAIGKGAGDLVHVTIVRDVEPRTVDVPADFAAALEAGPEAKAFFSSLSYTNRKEYVVWIASAKKQETREKRIAEAVARLGRKERL